MRSGALLVPNLHILVEPAGGAPGRRELIQTHNRIPLTGRNLLRDLLALTTPGTGVGFAPTHFGLGSGTTAPADGDSALQSELAGGRILITARKPDTSRLIYQLFLTSSQLNGTTISEAGLFDNSAVGTGLLLARATFIPITKTNLVQATFTWEIDIASAE